MFARFTAIFLLCGGFIAYAAQSGPAADLKALYDAHRWFELRDALSGNSSAPQLYRGAVAAAFNHIGEAKAALQPIIDDGTDADAPVAGQWLSYAYLRSGQYQEAAALIDDSSGIGQMIQQLPDQSVADFTPSTISSRIYQRKLYIPATIGTGQVEFFLDSDANFSFLSESEARHLGLTVRDSAATAHGVTGYATSLRVAVADEVRIGNLRLKNVTFVVLADSEEIFRNLDMAQQGALGIPVLLALRTIRLDAQGHAGIGLSVPDAKSTGAQLCFDGADPMVRTEFGKTPVPAILDTGAEVSEVWPLFSREFPQLVNAKRTSSKTENGVGGKSQVPEIVVPDLALCAGGFDLHLRPAHLLLAKTVPDSQWFYGRLGLDALREAHEVTIDFDSLRLILK